MKNIHFKSMKWVVALLLLCCFGPLSISAQPGITSNRNVIFLHGLNEPGSWNDFINRYNPNSGVERRFIGSRGVDYNSDGGLTTVYNDVQPQLIGTGQSSLAICHSLGGIVGRHFDSQPGTFVGGIVTVGSPLDGAPIANSLLNGTALYAINTSTNTMLRGPFATLGFVTGPLFSFGSQIITAAFLPFVVERFFDLDELGGFATINDIRVGGPGIEAEKALTPTATPKISIWGNEESPTHWSIAESKTNKDIPEIADITSTVYEIFFWTHLGVGAANAYNPFGWWNFFASFEWYQGWDWIDNDSERIWNNLIGSDIVATQCYQEPRLFCQLDENCIDIPRLWANCPTVCTPGTVSTCVQVHSNGISDAYIPATSQRGEGSNSWRVRTGSTTSSPVVKIEAFGVNHFEEHDANNGVMQGIFNQVFLASPGSGINPVFQINRR
jgi:pimeloyl-ACP methyl ester carboxylesterase